MEGDSLAGRFDTLPEILKANGYVTIGATATGVLPGSPLGVDEILSGSAPEPE